MTNGERAGTRERRRRMVELLGAGDVSVHRLAAEFGVSLSTVRRDLASLADRGRITRTYGGAVDHHLPERSWRDKEGGQRAEKAAIARAAAELVRPGDVVLLDAGTTVAGVAHELRDRTDVTLVTNGLSTLLELADADVELVVLGGRLRRPNEALLGARTLRELRGITPDLVFLGVDGLDARRGVNCPDHEQAALKEAMAECARAAWVLADHSKLGSAPSGGERAGSRTAVPAFPYWAAMPPGTGLMTTADDAALAAYEEERWNVSAVHAY
ncbi:DeoR/GlpR family DNA-binding transcription regulator [Streptomyces sp. NPDC000151]|uniref:DeoR/GlpR family DNA-binding transcription regulator n=1 Tax=Streptomyces sp. NPDC000151 TaxID=3154244 RepID=UPI00331861E1